jgi:chitinase
MFVTGYYGDWQVARYPIAAIDWSALTHVILHRVGPRAPGPTDAGNPYATIVSFHALHGVGDGGPSALAQFGAAARANGVHPILGFGGVYDHGAWREATSDANRAQFVEDVLDACEAWGYEGVDLDWEPIEAADRPQLLALTKDLRARAHARGMDRFLVTIPVDAWNMNFAVDPDAAAFWREMEPMLDQVLVMNYVGTGPYEGWRTWHFSPLFGYDAAHPSDVASTMARWSDDYGIPREKLAIGLGFYGIAAPPPVTSVKQEYPAEARVLYSDDNALSHGNIQRYFVGKAGAQYVWDETAMAGYLTWPAPFQPDWSDQYPGSPAPITQFLSFECEQSVAAKGAWVRENGYGGAMIWTLNEGTAFPYGEDGYANPLLEAVKRAFRRR